MLTSQEVKEAAKGFGADLVGIADLSRFDGLPPEQDPRFIAPQAQAMIGLGFRVLRGSLRGVEEGTQYYQYSTMGVVHIDDVLAPGVLRRLACFLEDQGFEGVVQRTIPDRRHAGEHHLNPEYGIMHTLNHARPVAPGKPKPDVMFDFKLAAYACGLGEIGQGGFFLTPQFGPLQRFAFVLTDAPLAPDPIYAGPAVCDRCGQCRAACPGNAISSTVQTTAAVAGARLTHDRVDSHQCSAYYMGAAVATNPFLAPDAFKDLPEGADLAAGRAKVSEELVEKIAPRLNGAYPGVSRGYRSSICGRACYRACLAHLEETGRLEHKFVQKFRTRPPWKLSA